jgi:hypothetical protein
MNAPTSPATDPRRRLWLAATLLVLCVAAVCRVHDLSAYPALREFDGPGHAANVVALERGQLPDPAGWGGFHPPLYPALGALVWRVLPESVPVHVGLRAISALAGAALAWIVARTLRRFVSDVDAMVVATLVFCAPVFAIASGMLGNEMLGACLVTIALERLASMPPPATAPRHAFWTGAWLGAALLTKSSALGAVGVAALTYAVSARAVPRRAIAAATLALTVPLTLASPHYVRLLRTGDAPLLSLVSGGGLSAHVRAEMSSQPPGERHAADYVSLPITAVLAPHHAAPGLDRSIPGLLYATTWGDGQGQFLPASQPEVLTAAAAVAAGGLVPTFLGLLGAGRVLRAPHRFRAAAGPLLFGALLFLAWLRYTWVLPAYSAVKASYLLPATLPAALLLAFGIDARSPRVRDAARAFCLLLALASSLLLWQGWWA